MLPAAIIGASLIGGLLNGQASSDAASAQRDAANSSNQLQKYMYDTSRADMQPWRDYGLSALDRLNGRDSNFSARSALQKQLEEAQTNSNNLATALRTGKDINGQGRYDENAPEWERGKAAQDALIAKLTGQIAGMGPARTLTGAEAGQELMAQDPGYQFRLDQGTKAMNAAASARGRSMGGAAMKELSRYGQDYASNEYGNAYNRLAAQAGVGQSATNSMANMGQQYAQQFGNNQAAIGNASAAGSIGQANAVNGMIQNGMNGYMMYNLFNKQA